MRNLARRLIAYETRGNKSREVSSPASRLISDKLRLHLTKLMGVGGFRALLLRALVLARAEVPWLHTIRVKINGSLEESEKLPVPLDPGGFSVGQIVLLAHLLGLLKDFIGEHFTLHVVHEVWPKFSYHDLSFGKGDKNEKAK
jgi:hypothetical protein